MEALDADKDGKVTKAELAAGVKTFFADADKAKKGTLDEAAIADGLNRIIPRPKGFPGGPGGPGGKKRPGGFGPFGLGTPIAASVVKRADAKKTGQMTADDLVSAAAALFVEADRNKDGKLDEDELAAGVGLLLPTGGFGPPGGFGGKGRREPGKPGPRVAPADVRAYPDAGLYDPAVLRTIFLDFENADWEAELADFRNTDVEVPATLTVDGKKYPNVGVHFRGMSSYMMVPAGSKRSLNLSVDLADRKQRLLGHKTLNLLNAADDPTFLHTVLFAHVARQYIPAPKANFVKVVINGESWGVYVNAQQFNKDFIKENFNTTRGARWKVKGSPGGAGGLDYLGENVQDYKRRYTIKSKDTAKDWKALIELCRVLDRTPLDQLEAALTPILDIDGVLKFLALDNVTINQDGYWIRASDYNLYRDPKGKFHVIPHDTNETFAPTMGFGFGKGGPGFGAGGKGGGYALDPLVGLDDARKPLRSRLLAVPSLRKRYLEHVRTIAERSLDWKTLGPVVARYRALIEGEVERDTRKLYALTEFVAALADTPAADGRASRYNLRAFADGRRAYLLQHQAIRALERANDVKR
ncbi:MAG: CotH kinase family protein [Gemmataceae bacterium]|nr:CotH kinase family protein [Gemmataceae bacterium]